MLGLVLLAWLSSFEGAFQYDDFKVIVDNPAVASLSAWWHSMPGMRPLLKLSFALNRTWASDADDLGLSGFHLINLCLHLCNAWLLYAIVLRLLQPAPNAMPVALLTALLFVVHPVQCEAVTMISGRSMSLMAVFYLSSLLAHLHRRRGLSIGLFAAALASRETALTLPLALILVERARTPQTPWRVLFRSVGGHALLAVLASGLLLWLPAFRYLAAVSLETRPLLDNLITQSGAQLYLFKQALWPLTLDADPTLPTFSVWNIYWASMASLWLALLAGAIRAWRGTGLMRWAGFGLFWFFLHLAPTNSLLPRLDIANERHLYLALIGLCLPVALGLSSVPRNQRLLLTGAAAALLLSLALGTHLRNRVYASEVTFWRDIALKNPANSRAYNNLGYALANDGEAAAALEAYDHALRLEPADFTARLNLRTLCRDATIAGRMDLAQRCRQALAPAPERQHR